MGGTFNPPHIAHLMIARAALDALPIGEVWLMPLGIPPHKQAPEASPSERLAMVEAMLRGEDRIRASGAETNRPGITYTLDTMRGLYANNTPADPVTYINLIGADLLLSLDKWKGADELLRTREFAVFPRAGTSRVEAESAARGLRRDYGARIVWIEAALPDISSTELRARVRAGLSIERYATASVQEYIDRVRLYNPPLALSRADMIAILRDTLSKRRFEHSLAVERKSAELAKIHNVPEDKAALAGLLHDCAKYLPIETMRGEAARLGVEPDPSRWSDAGLLHSITGAAMLRERFGVTDPDVLSAVRHHNTGRAGMTELDTVVYLADKIEDTRKPYPGLACIRALAGADLLGAAAACMRGVIKHVLSRGQSPHPDTASALSYLESIKNPNPRAHTASEGE